VSDLKTLLTARAAELGRPLGELLAAARLDYSALNRAPGSGRRLDTYERIARAFDLDLAVVIGCPPPPPPTDAVVMEQAYLSAVRVLGWTRHATPAAAVWQQAALIYDLLMSRRRRGLPNEPDDIWALEEAIRGQARAIAAIIRATGKPT
jgi:hypothetical protein